ncbi:hypothetical protein FKP32DRAFT_1588487 [Trametes sanguinea]|nr:hypothetical protein FKP32DRAFT_1588487 [Trametes sanguinea]
MAGKRLTGMLCEGRLAALSQSEALACVCRTFRHFLGHELRHSLKLHALLTQYEPPSRTIAFALASKQPVNS